MIRLESVTKRYENGLVAVRDLTLEVPAGEVCVLVGPSGCGKTTTMRMINRLVEPTSGRIHLDGEDVLSIDPVELRRRIGYVIQHVGLFPHQTVGDNVATVPRLLGWPRARIRARVDELLALVGLDPSIYRSRYPHQLSGGQAQRVGVARALGADPPVLLMDEPFGAIDPITRDRLQSEFARLQADVAKTVVFVTHDIDEAVRVGDRIAILAEGGVLAQYDTPANVLGAPADEFVAGFVGSDRGLKRLAVTAVADASLAPADALDVDLPTADARRLLDDLGTTRSLVVDGEGRLLGVVERADLTGDARLADVVRAVAGTVTPATTLKDALAATMLQDAAWVAVVDDDQRLIGVLGLNELHAAARRDRDGRAR